MRTCSVVYFLLVVAAHAWGGQRDHPDLPLIHSDRTHMSGELPSSTAEAMAEMVTHVVRPRWMPSPLQGPGLRHELPSSFKRIIGTAGPEPNFPGVGTAQADPRANRTFSETSDPIFNAISTKNSRLTPFDTVRETRSDGDRMHIFSYERGLLTRRSVKRLFTDSWVLDEDHLYSYTSSGLLAKETALSGDGSRRSIWTILHDAEGRWVSTRYEYFDDNENEPPLSFLDSVAYDARGSEIYFGTRWWRGNILGGGGENSTSRTDSSEVITHAEWHRGDWEFIARRISTFSVDGSVYISQLRKGDVWVNERMTSYTYLNRGSESHVREYTWNNDAWVATSHGMSRYIGLERSGYDEIWDGTAWHLTSQWWGKADPSGRDVIRTVIAWNEGQAITTQLSWEYGMDGSIRLTELVDGQLHYTSTSMTDVSGNTLTSDSTWTNGRLVACSQSRTSASAECSLAESLQWDEGVGSWTGSHSETRRTPNGDPSEIFTCSWGDGAWRPEERYLFSYDDAGRVRSLEFFVGKDGQWIASHDLQDQGGSDRWRSWAFSCTDGFRIQFQGFDALTFSYGTDVNAVEAAATGRPEHTEVAQNYPNPFNPTTTIPFSVATGARTAVVIYDVLGREVARPVDAWKDPGEYRVEFNANGLASGMYVCRFTSGSVSQTRKLMLVR